MEVANIPKIKRLKLPEGWTNGRQVLDQSGNSYLYYYGPQGQTEIFSIFYRGHTVSQEHGSAFERILTVPAHVLSKDEVASICEIIGNIAKLTDVCQLYEARTVVLSGEKVLIVTGHYLEFNEEVQTVYVNGGNDGCAVLEIHLKATPEVFERHKDAVATALKGIEWK